MGWREGTLTRAKELESLCDWVCENNPQAGCQAISEAIRPHIEAARQAAEAAELRPRKWFRNGPRLERAMSNLDAAEAQILNLAAPEYVLGQMPSLLRHVQCHLIPTDPRRQTFERIAQELGVQDPDQLRHQRRHSTPEEDRDSQEERGKIVTAVRGASSAALREQLRLRSFRNVVVLTTVLMALLAIGVALTGYFHKTWIPLCFKPESGAEAMVVCPIEQSQPFDISPEGTTAE